MLPCSSTCPNYLSAFGLWLRPVYTNGSHPVCLSLSMSCAMSAVHDAQQETEETAGYFGSRSTLIKRSKK